MKGCLLFAFAAILVCLASATLDTLASYKQYCLNHQAQPSSLPANCLDLLCQGYKASGVYTIYPNRRVHYSYQVYCDQKTAGGGWLVFQRRMNGKTDFYREYESYKLGFGDVNGEHWLGNLRLAELMASTPMNLRVDMADFDNNVRQANYSTFAVAGEEEGFKLTVSGYAGDAGDSMGANGQKFSTYDLDQDVWENNCASKFKGAWWYSNCHSSNLNGFYHNGTHESYADGINWYTWKGHHYSLKTTSMKIRPNL